MSERPGSINFWRGFKVVMFVTLAGPPVGGLLLMAFVVVRTLYTNGIAYFALIDAPAVASVALWVSAFSFIFGGLPAVISGVLFGIRAGKGQTCSVWQTLGIVGAALLITAVVFRTIPLRDDSTANVFALVAVLAPLAAGAALVCRWLMIKIRLLPRI